MASDREILRELAGRIAGIAALDVQDRTRALYRGINDLRMIRPVVLLDELPWNQLEGDGELEPRCEDELLRGAEIWMRRTLWKWDHCRGDMLVDPFYPLDRVIRIGDIGVKTREETLATDRGNNIISHHYEDELETWEDLEKLHVPEITVDDELTARRCEKLEAAFGDLLPVRVMGYRYGGFYKPWDELSRWRGVEPIYMGLIEEPEFMHATVKKLLEIDLETLRIEEEMGLLESYQPLLHCTCGLTDDLPAPENGHVTRRNLWGRGTAQAFGSVSPEMTDEFEIPYAQEFFKDFGLLYYGCCEPLHEKISIVKKLPNLRKISITPWANVPRAAEQMGKDYVLSRKPNPAAVATDSLQEDVIRADILETLTACRENGTPCEFILKDISSVNYHPENLTRWEQIVSETVRNF